MRTKQKLHPNIDQKAKGKLKASTTKKDHAKTPAKQVTQEELAIIKDTLKGVAYGGSEPDRVMKQLAEDLLPSLRSGVIDRNATKKSADTFRKAMEVYSLDTHFLLSETVEKQYRAQVIEFSRQLIIDYNCQTAGEKALAEIIVSAYARVLRYSRYLNAATDRESINSTHVALFSVISKELDRANRHFNTALTTLIQIKSPSPEINIRAKTAFVAQNQQINVNHKNTTNHEIIDPK